MTGWNEKRAGWTAYNEHDELVRAMRQIADMQEVVTTACDYVAQFRNGLYKDTERYFTIMEDAVESYIGEHYEP